MKRRIIAALAALGIGVTALAGVTPAAATQPPQPPYVALGDSVASGNGNLPYLDEACLRSKRSYPMLLASTLGMAVDSRACSGAATEEVALQVAAAGLSTETKLVTLTVGVNDVKWPAELDPNPDPDADWIDALGACSNLGSPAACTGALALSHAVLTPLPLKLQPLLAAIRAKAPAAHIVVTGYPLLFGDFSGTCRVGLLRNEAAGVQTQMTFAEDQAAAINTEVRYINERLATGVALYSATSGDLNVEFVDVNADPAQGATSFVGHALCDTGAPWLSHLIPPPARTADRGFHPNAAGQRAYAAIVADAVAP